MELLERSLREERVVLRESGRKRKKNWFLYADGLARPCHHRHGSCQASGHGLQNFFLFSNLVWTNTCKIKAIKLMGCLPRSTHLTSLA